MPSPAGSVVQRAFTSGEISPAAAARADLVKYTSGLRTCRNFIVQKHGGVTKRPGFRFIAKTKFGALGCRLVPFIFEAADQTYVLEVGEYYIRFFWHGAPVMDGGSPLEVVTPWNHNEAQEVRWSQSADVIIFTHPNHPVMQLERQAHTTWVLSAKVFTPTIEPPLGIVGSFLGTGTYNPTNVVTSQKIGTYEESLGSPPLSLTGAPMPTPSSPISIHHTYPADGAAQYNVYCDPYGNGIFGLLGSYEKSYLGFNDVGFLPDYTISPPIAQVVFDAPGNYPACCTFFQQRIWFARSNNEREKIWGSRVGAFSNFAISVPLQDDDAVNFVLAQKTLSPVVDLIPMRQLIVLTDTGEWRIRGDQDNVVTPTGINAEPESYAGGSEFVRPITIGNTVLYCQARGTIVRELKFDFTAQGFVTRDLTLFSNHLFGASSLGDVGKVCFLMDMTYQQQPNSIVWTVRANDGVLLGLTYVPDQEIEGWHRHDTDGMFEQVTAVPNTSIGEDELYAVIIRHIGGVDTRYIEKLDRMQVDEEADWFFVDSGLTYEGPPASSFSGLGHLEGKVVAVLGDGQVVFDGDPSSPRAAAFTVTGGAIAALGASYSKVHAGLPIRFAEVQFLSIDVQGVAIREKRKQVRAISLVLDQSSISFWAGRDLDHLIKKRPEAWEVAAARVTGLYELNITTNFDENASGWVRHTDPTPFTLLAAIPLLAVGG
jgi:hypothetical protein